MTEERKVNVECASCSYNSLAYMIKSAECIIISYPYLNFEDFTFDYRYEQYSDERDCVMSYWRYETNEEKEKRVSKEEEAKKLREASELLQYKMLKKKFGS